MPRILIHHHDAVQRQFLASLIDHSKMEVESCGCVEDALTLMQQNGPVQALVYDVDHPTDTVWEFCHQVRHAHHGQYSHIPVVYVSSSLSPKDGERLTRQLGGGAFLRLPVEPRHLLHSVRSVLEGRSVIESPRVMLLGADGQWLHRQSLAFQRQGWTVAECHRLSDFHMCGKEQPRDLVVIHYSFLEGEGGERLSAMRAHAMPAPVFLIADGHDSTLALDALGEGVEACIPESFGPVYVVLMAAKQGWERQAVSMAQDAEVSMARQKQGGMVWNQFLRTFNDIALLVDKEGVILDINEYGSRVLGWPAKDLTGHTLVMVEPSISVEWSHLARHVHGERETQFRTRHGETIHVAVSLYPMKWEEEERLILVAKDQQEVAFLRTQVRALKEQVQQLEEQDSVGRIAGGIAHDVNNILTAIQGHASLLVHKGLTDSSTQRPAEVIRQAAHRGQELTAQLLGAARRKKERRVSINAHEAIEEVLSLLATERLQHITVIRQFHAQDSWLDANPRQLHQVFLNLLVNACQAMGKEGTLTLTTLNHANGLPGDAAHSQGTWLEIVISDTGCGIPEDLKQAIFEPFFSTKSSEEGSGMGLAIVKDVIKAHGGRISLDSAPHQGATFHLYFPQHIVRRSELIDLPALLGKAHPKVLVVDDDPLVLETTVEMFRFFDCHPMSARSGEEALELYRHEGADIGLVILDVSLPGLTSEECFKTIKALNPSVRVVLCSGMEKSVCLEKLCDEGSVGFVEKPFDVEDLSLALHHVFTHNQVEMPVAAAGPSSGGRSGS